IAAPVSTFLIFMSASVLTLIRRHRRQPDVKLWANLQRLRPLRFGLVYGVALALAYGLVVPAFWFFDRYEQPLGIFTLIAGVALLPEPGSLASVRSRRQLRGAVAALVLVEALAGARLLVVRPDPNGYLGIAQWADAQLAGSTVAAYQPGALYYWATRIRIVD